MAKMAKSKDAIYSFNEPSNLNESVDSKTAVGTDIYSEDLGLNAEKHCECFKTTSLEELKPKSAGCISEPVCQNEDDTVVDTECDKHEHDSGEDEVDMGMARTTQPVHVWAQISSNRGPNSSSSASINSDHQAQIDDYFVGNLKVTEVHSSPSFHPQLFSQKSNDPTDMKPIRISGNGQKFSSTSSIASDCSDYKIVKRKSKILKIAGDTDFFELQTVKYKHNEKTQRQHYMKNLPKDVEKDVTGDIGLRAGDQLLEVNKTSLENKTQKNVLKIFKRIKPEINGNIAITLLFRRWEPRRIDNEDVQYEINYQLHLVLEPVNQSTTAKFLSRRIGRDRMKTYRVLDKKQEETNAEELPKGQIDNIVSKGRDKHRIEPSEYKGEFLTVSHDGLVALEVWNETNSSENVFQFDFFRGNDRSQEPLSQFIYCCRVSCSGPLGTRYLTLESDVLANSGLIFHISKIQTVNRPSDVDESCFILRGLGREYLFESLLHRGYYIGCKSGDGSQFQQFVMIQKSKHEVIEDSDLDDVKFRLWSVKEEPKKILDRIIHSTLINTLLTCSGRSSGSPR